MSSSEFVDLLTQLGIMLSAGVVLGFGLRRLRQPTVVGEMLAGVLLGVTVLGSLAPGLYGWLFDSGDLVTSTRGDIIKLGMLFFLYVAGSEVDLSDVKTLGRRSLVIGAVGTVVPILGGIGLVYATPVSLWGETIGVGRLPFAAFVGMNLANSANPVLARILIDLGLMKSRIATVMMTATVVDDLINWTLYAVILGSVSVDNETNSSGLAIDLLLVAGLFVAVLGGVRWLAPYLVDVARRHLGWPTGYVAVVALVIIAVSAVSEAIGVQAFLGAFLTGVAFSGVANTTGAAGHRSLSHVAVGFFAPLFFVSMALRTDFVDSFDVALVATVVGFALVSKLLAVVLGVRLAGLPVGREAWAMAWGLNARGATGIILAATGLQAGIIGDEVFVALVVMAIVTSILAGPMMVRALGPLRAEMTDDVDVLVHDGLAPAMAHAARVVDRDLTAAERAEPMGAALYRVFVAIDDPVTAVPLAEVAADLAASQQPAEVVLAVFTKQTGAGGRVMLNVMDSIASELDSLRLLEQIVQAHGVSAVSVSQGSASLAADISAQSREVGAHALVTGDPRDDREWAAALDGLIAARPTDISIVVSPGPPHSPIPRTGGPVVEFADGPSGEASLEVAVRLALSGTAGPTVVGVAAGSRAARPYQVVLNRFAQVGRPGRIEEAALGTADGARVTTNARCVVRPFQARNGLKPLLQARVDAERFGCPLVLVAPEPDRSRRVRLTSLIDQADSALPAGVD